MPKLAKPLTDTAIDALRPRVTAYKRPDGNGLHLLVTPGGSKLWRVRFRVPTGESKSRESMLAIGSYPKTTLAEARKRALAIGAELEAGIDPAVAKQARRRATADTFEAVAREWYAVKSPEWVPAHGVRILRRLERDVFPLLGKRPVAAIELPEVVDVVNRIVKRGAIETAHRALVNIGQVLRFAVQTGRAARVVTDDAAGALPAAREQPHAAVTTPKAVGALLRTLDGYKGTPAVRAALRLAPLVAVRPGELRQARWSDIDLDAAEWTFTLSKTRKAHTVPLSKQAVATLRELHPLTGDGVYVFPSARGRSRPMSDNAVLSAMRSCGVPRETMSGHGWRAAFRTAGDQVLKVRVDWLEHQLGHAVKDPNGRAYNRTSFLPERRELMQRWADALDTWKAEAAT